MKPKEQQEGESKSATDTWRTEFERQHALGQELLRNIKRRLAELEKLRGEVSSHWHAEDGFYRFYHQSFKVYQLQEDTSRIVKTMRSLLPERPLNDWFEQIVREGTGKEFQLEHNQRWLQETRPILERFFMPGRCSSLRFGTARNWTRRPRCCRAAGRRCCTCIICGDKARSHYCLSSATC